MRQLTAHGRVLRPYLGLKFIELSEPVAEELNARAAEKESRGLFGGGHVARVPARGLYVMHVTPARRRSGPPSCPPWLERSSTSPGGIERGESAS